MKNKNEVTILEGVVENSKDIAIAEMVEIEIFGEKKQILPTEVFTPKGMDIMLASIKEVVDKLPSDMTTKEGIEEIRSNAYTISTIKGKFEKHKKQLTEDLVVQKKRIDIEGNKAKDTLQLWQDEYRLPLTEYENREKKRIADCQERIAEIEAFKSLRDVSVDDFSQAGKKVLELAEYDWDLFSGKAKKVVAEIVEYLEAEKTKVIEQEEEKAELEALRKEKEERDQKEADRLLKEAEESAEKARKENEERIARESAEKAKKEAEEKAHIEKQRIEEEQRKKDLAELIARERAEQEAKDREAKIEAEKKEAEQAKLDAEKRAKEAEQRAKESAQKALEEERTRVEAEREQNLKLAARREANKKHNAKIHNEIIKDLINVKSEFQPTVDVEYYKAIITAIAKGEIRNVSIKY